MAKQNNSSCKTLEVVWNRNNITQGLKCLPKMKEINIDDSVTKVKKSSKSDCFLRNIKINEKKVEHVHKCVKRSLFQDNEKLNKLSTSHKLNKKHFELNNLKRSSDEVTETLEMYCPKSSKILSNQETLKGNHDRSFRKKKHPVQTENEKIVELPASYSVNDMSTKKSDYIGDQIYPRTRDKSFTKSPEIISNIFHNNFTGLRKRSNDLSEACKTYCIKSPEIVSNRVKLMRNQESIFRKTKHRSVQTRSETTSNNDNISINKSLYIVDQVNPHTRDFDCPKSPEIMSNRSRCYIENNSDDKFNLYYKCTQAPKISNEKSLSLNTCSGKVQSKLNSVDSEDIIESSEILYPPTKHKSKKKKKKDCLNKRTKISNCRNKNKFGEFDDKNRGTDLHRNEFIKSPKIEELNKNKSCNEIYVELLDIINTENILKSPVIESKIKSSQLKPKKSLIEPLENQNRSITESFKVNDNIEKKISNNYLFPPSLDFKKTIVESMEDDLKMLMPTSKRNLNENKNQSLSCTHSSELSVIPATPEHDRVIVDKNTIEKCPGTLSNKYVPLIEVDHSPKTQHTNNFHGLIQPVPSPVNVDCVILPGLFEPVVSPTQSITNSELPFKIDSVVSPSAFNENDHESLFSPELGRKKTKNSPSPHCYNSTKKRKKVCKNGLRRKFQDLINHKKSEACIREYEKNLSKNYQPKQGKSLLLNVIEAWKEFKTFVLFCYYIKSETEVQKVLVTLDNCPKNATKNSIIRIYSPWLTIESKTTEILLFIGIIHAEVIECSGSIRSLEPTGLFKSVNGLLTTVYQSEVVWKCTCSEEAACQCLGELNIYNYLQYMFSH